MDNVSETHQNDRINNGNDITCSEHSLNFMLTNARSLKPKLDSMVDAFESLSLDFLCVTETWFKGGKELAGAISDLQGKSGISIIHKSRDGRARTRGGGVAIASDSNSCNFKRRTLGVAAKGLEIVCVTGRVKKITRKIAVFTVYIPPKSSAADLATLEEVLSLEIDAVRASLGDPLIVVGGDLNNRRLGLNDGGSRTLDRIVTPPTRGNNVLDVVFCNFSDAVENVEVLGPLQGNNGVFSDHKCVSVNASFPPTREFSWEVKWVRKKTNEGMRGFAEDCKNWDWSALHAAEDPDSMVDEFEKAMEALADKHFPLTRIRKRSNEWPWITISIRRLWKKKLRLYRRAGRCQAWWDTDDRLQQELKEAQEAYVGRMLEQGNAGKSFYAATKKLSEPG